MFQCDDTRGCIVQFWLTDDEHLCSKHVEAWNKLIIKFSASRWLILRHIEKHGQQNIKIYPSWVGYIKLYRSHWPRSLRRRSAAARLLRLWVRIPPEAWMFVCCECCVMLGRGLCDGLITRPEKSYRMWCVVVCDQETSWLRRLCPTGGCCAQK